VISIRTRVMCYVHVNNNHESDDDDEDGGGDEDQHFVKRMGVATEYFIVGSGVQFKWLVYCYVNVATCLLPT